MRRHALCLLMLCLVMWTLASCSDDSSNIASPPAPTEDFTNATETEFPPLSVIGDDNISLQYQSVIGGTTNLAVILAEFNDTASTNPDKSFVVHPEHETLIMDALVGTDGSLNQLYDQMTGHMQDPVSFPASVVDRLTIDSDLRGEPADCRSQTYSWARAAVDSALSHGVDFDPYQAIMVVMATDNSCTANNFLLSAAFHYFSPKPAVIMNNWDYSNNDYAHELGHLLGCSHSNNTEFEYWDYSCLMGENAEYNQNGNPVAPIPPRHMNVIWKIAKGYIDPLTEMQHVSGGGTSTVYVAPSEYAPSEVVNPTGGQAYRAVRVQGAHEIYYVSYRQPRVPFDVAREGDGPLESTMHRVLVHRFDHSIHSDGKKAAELVAILEATPGLDTFQADDVVITAITDGLDIDVDYVEVSVTLDDCAVGFDVTIDSPVIYQSADRTKFPRSATFTFDAENLSQPICGDETLSYMIEPPSGAAWNPSPASFVDVDIAGGATEPVSVQMIFFGDPGDGQYPGEAHFAVDGDTILTTPVTWVLDRVDPSTPTGLIADLVGSDVTLTWQASNDVTSGVDHYTVYDGGSVVATGVEATQFVYSLPGDGVYEFNVVAHDAAGRTSAPTASQSVTYDTTPPTIPTGLVSNLIGSDVTLSWQASTDATSGVDHYVVHEGTNIVASDVQGTQFVYSLAADGVYSFTVLAEDAVGNQSLQSGAVDVTYDTTPPTIPTGLAAVQQGCSIDLSWDASVDALVGVSHYEIYKDGQLLDETPDTQYGDSAQGDVSGAYHAYTVKAVDNIGNVSGESAAAALTLPDIGIHDLVVRRTNGVDCTITVTWETDLASSSTVLYGDACNSLGFIATGSSGVTSHEVVCDVVDVQQFAFVVQSSDGCVVERTDCQLKRRGICISGPGF